MRLITIQVVDAANTIAKPAAPSVAPQGTTGSTTYSYSVAARLAGGSTTGVSPTGSTSTGNATLTTSHFNRITITPLTNAVSYDVYRNSGGASQGYMGNTTSTTFDDNGTYDPRSPAPVDGLIPIVINPASILSIVLKADGAHPQIGATIKMSNGDTYDVNSAPDDVTSLATESTVAAGVSVGATKGGGVSIGGGGTGGGSGRVIQ